MMPELRRVYADLNTPPGAAEPIMPESFGYRGGDVRSELVAEAIRAYMADPNYLKSVAPKTAGAIRKAANEHEQVRRAIEFNAVGIPVGIGVAGGSEKEG
jgi:hypothetical protein